MGAMSRHIIWVCGNPCRSNTGGPEPPRLTKTVVSSVSTFSREKSSSTGVIRLYYCADRGAATTPLTPLPGRGNISAIGVEQEAGQVADLGEATIEALGAQV